MNNPVSVFLQLPNGIRTISDTGNWINFYIYFPSNEAISAMKGEA